MIVWFRRLLRLVIIPFEGRIKWRIVTVFWKRILVLVSNRIAVVSVVLSTKILSKHWMLVGLHLMVHLVKGVMVMKVLMWNEESLRRREPPQTHKPPSF